MSSNDARLEQYLAVDLAINVAKVRSHAYLANMKQWEFFVHNDKLDKLPLQRLRRRVREEINVIPGLHAVVLETDFGTSILVRKINPLKV